MQMAMTMSSVPLPNAMGLDLADVANCWGEGGSRRKAIVFEKPTGILGTLGMLSRYSLTPHYETGTALPLHDGKREGRATKNL